ncbi:hypothetical protein [Streptomyces sp. BE303]|uniref:hypothetical protein n=1 Tax=Streptomyces sp. BE303 TaxID=3002528 RepID=UPI002E7AA6DF|nr:hypothetical protein [Streptomyces sp. BE303]MED7953297.1 hypothetical protein [Streptomyces sp. BE303]
MADLERRRNEELARILHQLGWNPERLAREVNLALPARLAISSTAPYKWRDRGMVPRSPHDQAVCEVLSRTLGIAVTYEQLWGRMGGHRGAKILSPRLLTDPWTADTAQTALREAATDAGPVRLADLFRDSDLAEAARRLTTPPPPVAGGDGVLRIAPGLVGELDLGYRSKLRLERSCGGGLVLGPARAELAMVAKLLELGAYDEPLGRALYGAASRLAGLAGWAAYDLGHEAAAQRAFAAALRAAHVSGEHGQGVAVVGGLVVLATQGAGGRGPDVVTVLAEAVAAAGDALGPADRALQFGRIARAYGRRGHGDALAEAAERAFTELGAVGVGTAAGAGRAVAGGAEADGHGGGDGAGPDEVRADLAGMVGEGYLFLGDHRRAQALLAEAVAGLGPDRARARALLMVRLADSRRRTGDTASAIATADEARALAAGMQSERVARALRDIDAAFRAAAVTVPSSAATADPAETATEAAAAAASAGVPGVAEVPGPRDGGAVGGTAAGARTGTTRGGAEETAGTAVAV